MWWYVRCSMRFVGDDNRRSGSIPVASPLGTCPTRPNVDFRLGSLD